MKSNCTMVPREYHVSIINHQYICCMISISHISFFFLVVLFALLPPIIATSHHTTERLPSQQFHFSTLVDVPIETTDPHTIFTAATQLGDLGVNNPLQGSGLRISQIAVIVGSMCLVIPILIIGIFVWRRNR